MAKTQLALSFPKRLIKEPVIYTMAKRFDVMPNIRRAKVTDVIAEVTLDLEGKEKDLEKAIKYLKKKGVKVEITL